MSGVGVHVPLEKPSPSGGTAVTMEVPNDSGTTKLPGCVRAPPQAESWARRFVVRTVFPRVASRANMLCVAARTLTAVVCLHAAHIAALR